MNPGGLEWTGDIPAERGSKTGETAALHGRRKWLSSWLSGSFPPGGELSGLGAQLILSRGELSEFGAQLILSRGELSGLGAQLILSRGELSGLGAQLILFRGELSGLGA
jgi:hypothetical protein